MVRVLPIHFGEVLGCKGGGGKKQLFGSQTVFRCWHSKQSYGPDIPPRQGLTVYFCVVLGCKGRGGKKQFVQAPKSCFRVWAPETRQHMQDKPRQAKGSLRGQMTYSEPGLCLAEAVGISLGDPVRGRIFLGPYRVCPRHGSSAVHNFSFEEQLLNK